MEFHLSRSLLANFSFTKWNFGYHRSFSWIFLSHNGISSIMEPSRELFFHIMEFQLSRSLLANFSFTQWNFGYHGAFQELFFHTMECWLSRSLSQTFTNFFLWWNSSYQEPFSNFHEFLLMMEFSLSRSLSQTFKNFFLWWSFSWTFLSHDGTSAIT
jgi:hypothetical protein